MVTQLHRDRHQSYQNFSVYIFFSSHSRAHSAEPPFTLPQSPSLASYLLCQQVEIGRITCKGAGITTKLFRKKRSYLVYGEKNVGYLSEKLAISLIDVIRYRRV